MIMRAHLTILVVLCLTGSILGQSGFDYTKKDYIRKEEPFSLPASGAYALSTQKYLANQDDEPETPTACLQLGDNYRLNGQPVESALWYARGIKEIRTPDDYRHYAHVLKMIGQCDQADNWYAKYLSAIGESERSICGDVVGREALEVALRPAVGLNSAGSEFAGLLWDNKLWFTTDRNYSRPGLLKDPWTMRGFTEQFIAQQDASGYWNAGQPLREACSRFHDGVAAPSPDDRTLYLTRTEDGSPNEAGLQDLAIWEFRLDGSRWKEVRKMPFCSPSYGTCHPTLSADGLTMIFASDMPGGLGGMDLYIVYKEGASWSKPVNLGEDINSPGQELFPSLSKDGYLFYASDGRTGFGGLDVFVASPEEQSFGMGRNLGKQVNTTYDDFALTTLPGRRAGFLSSNRPGGMGSDDIYEWSSNQPLGDRILAETEILVVDAETGLPIPGAVVRFANRNLEVLEDGRLMLRSPYAGTQQVKVSAPGFVDGTFAVDLPTDKEQVLKLSPGVFQPFVFDVRDQGSQSPVTDPEVEVFEIGPNGEQRAITHPALRAGRADAPAVLPAGSVLVEGRLLTLKDQNTGKPIDHAILQSIPGAELIRPGEDLASSVRQSYVLRNGRDLEIIDWSEVSVTDATDQVLGGDLADPNNRFPESLNVLEGHVIRLREQASGRYVHDILLQRLPGKTGHDPESGVPFAEWVQQNYILRDEASLRNVDWGDMAIEDQTYRYLAYADEAAAIDAVRTNPWLLDERKRYQVRARAKGYLGTVISLSAPEIQGMGPLITKTIFIEPIILGIEEEDLTEGASFKLEGIYYDYDKADIRADARPILDELIRLMNKFPEMSIELSSHTDCRGRDSYNKDLSERRAQAAVRYIIDRGIARDRLRPIGYGEELLVNDCDDGVPCAESDHQLNRRTEFKILQM